MPRTKTTADFIIRATQIHGNKYNYSKSVYTGHKKCVCIICQKHGEFLQSPNCHLQGAGCTRCAIERRLKNINDIIFDFKKTHGDIYDYSKVVYRDDSTKVCIVCEEHGEFWQEPGSHKRGVGCPKCHEEGRKKSKFDFVKEAKNIHGDIYDYSKTEYVNGKKRINVVCKKHGAFSVIARLHINRKQGCKKCKDEQKNEEFIEIAKKTHGDIYDYSQSKYCGADKKICIVCKKHGEFYPLAKNHLKGYRCAKCSKIILKDDTVCDSQIEAYMYLKHKEENLFFLHNKRYGKELGGMRYDFYFPSTNTYEEVTAYDFKTEKASSIEKRLKPSYLKKIEKKKEFVEKNGGKFIFLEMRLTREQQVLVFANLKKETKEDGIKEVPIVF